jgi:serine/threonine-protein kinase
VLRARIAYRQSRLGNDPSRAAPLIEKGMGFVEGAIRRDPKNANALELRGTLRYWSYLLRLAPTPAATANLLKQAEADLRAAVALTPTQASAWSVLSHLDYQKPDYIQAKIDAQRAYEADAYLSAADQILWRLYVTSYDLEQFADAARWCDEGQRRFPENPLFVECRLWLMTTPVREADGALAWRLVDTLAKRTPQQQWKLKRLQVQNAVAAVLARAGLADSARRVIERSRGDPEVDPERELLGVAAFAYTVLGDRDAALRLLKEQMAANPAHRVGLARSSHWWWRSLHDDPRFQELVGTQR